MPKITNPWVGVVLQLVIFVVAAFPAQLIITGDSPAAALVASLLYGIVFVAVIGWQARRSRT